MRTMGLYGTHGMIEDREKWIALVRRLWRERRDDQVYLGLAEWRRDRGLRKRQRELIGNAIAYVRWITKRINAAKGEEKGEVTL